MTLLASEVYTPGAFPVLTYVERSGPRLEQVLRDALDTAGQIVSLVGPSKSGKTVLVEKVVGQDNLITVTGAGIGHPNDIWDKVLDLLGAPSATTATTKTSGKISAEAGGSGSIGIPGLGGGSAQGKAGGEIGHERAKDVTSGRRGLRQVVDEVANSKFVVLVDDFHYMPREIQADAAKSLKEAARLGVKIVTAAVVHRGDDLVRANPELRGRVRSIDLHYWSTEDLKRIATAGFEALNASGDSEMISRLAEEAAGSPQLMQLLCLQACFVLGVRQRLDTKRVVCATAGEMSKVLQETSANTDFRSLVDVIDAGPRTRGVERKMYKFNDGTEGDVYRCVLKAVAANPPRLSFKYDELTKRTQTICAGDSPVGSSISGTCLQMSRLALEKFPDERSVDWDEQKQVLDLPDPYLVFYLRWSTRLMQP